MGLENLKSVFSNIEKMDRTDLSEMDSRFQSGPIHPENDGVYNPGMPKTSEFQSGPLGLVNNGNDGIYNPENLFTNGSPLEAGEEKVQDDEEELPF